jgi:hypothetical protein
MNALETKVLEIIGESTSAPDVFVDTDAGMAPIRDSLNDAIQEVAMLTGGNKRTYFVPLRQEIGFYRIYLKYGEVGWIAGVWSSNQQRRLEQTDLIRVSAYNPNWMQVSGSPEVYLPLGKDIIGFYPKPGSDGDVVQLTVVEIPAPYTNPSERIKLRDQLQYGIVHYAVSDYWASRGDAREAETHLGMYLDVLGIRKEWSAAREESGLTTNKEPWPVATS